MDSPRSHRYNLSIQVFSEDRIHMAEKRPQRRLTAVLVAEAVGYTLLTQRRGLVRTRRPDALPGVVRQDGPAQLKAALARRICRLPASTPRILRRS